MLVDRELIHFLSHHYREMKQLMTNFSMLNVSSILMKEVFVIPGYILAHMDGLSLSRLSHSLFNSLEDLQLTDSINSGSHQSSLDDDERASGLPIIDDSSNKCSIEILMLVFYGGKS